MDGSINGAWGELPELPYIGDYEPDVNTPQRDVPSDAFVDAFKKKLKNKSMKIKQFLDEHSDNLYLYVEQLKKFASSPGGLISDEYREKIWPVLARSYPSDFDYIKNSEDSESDSDYDTVSSTLDAEYDEDYIEPTIEMLQLHKDWKQVQLDVHRTLERFPPFIDQEKRNVLMEELTPFIVKVLYRNRKFHYYQGFHDVCLTIVLVVGLDIGYEICKSLTRKGVFTNYLKKSLEDSVMKQLELMFPIIYKRSKVIDKALKDSNMTCIFALSWPLTWLSHSLQNYEHIILCFDLFLSSHSLMPIYLSSALILSREKEIQECENDMGLLFGILNKIPKNCQIHEIIVDAQNLFQDYPPLNLKKRLMNEYLEDRKTPIPRPKDPIPRNYTYGFLVASGVAVLAAFYLYIHIQNSVFNYFF